MGWLCDTYPRSKADFIRSRFQDFAPAAEVIAHHCVTRTLWMVLEVKDNSKHYTRWPVGHRFLLLDLVECEKGCWGYKDMDETCGPYESDCPLRFLDMVPQPEGQYVADFRQRVRDFHAKKRDRQKAAAGNAHLLKEGGKIMLYGIGYTLSRKRDRSWLAYRHGGGLTRIGPKHFAKAEAFPEPAAIAPPPPAPLSAAASATGYVSLPEAFKSMRFLNLDYHFTPCRLSELKTSLDGGEADEEVA